MKVGDLVMFTHHSIAKRDAWVGTVVEIPEGSRHRVRVWWSNTRETYANMAASLKVISEAR